ncbi:hypothetical protein BX070DRAFT_16303 [Coemansia spiralis]|nr:hypothetical protein BX070DRAFT_16303 [Coemansia spiralis]
MSPRTKTPASSRPGTPSSLGLSGTNNTTQPTMRSVSSSSSTSQKASTPCFHTTRPQFISSHIERCEACRLKYARQAEASANIPFSFATSRRTSGVHQQPQQRSRSRQSLGGNNRPSSAASVGLPASPSPYSAQTITSMRPSSRASVASVASKGNEPARHTRPAHRRSSSAESPLVKTKKDGKQTMASVAEESAASTAAGAGPVASSSRPIPPSRGDDPLSTISSSDGIPTSPTEAVAMRARNRPLRNAAKAQGATATGGEVRGGRRGSAHSVHASRHTENESPVSFIRTAAHRTISAQHPPSFPGNIGNFADIQEVDITGALIGSLIDSSRDVNKVTEKYEAKIAQLQEELQEERRKSTHAQPNEAATETHDQEPGNIFGAHSTDTKRKTLERAMELDKKALGKFEEFRKAYEDCEPSLRLNRAHFAGERPLSPPPARNWMGTVSTPMRPLDGDDYDARRATINAAEVRRAGEDLLSTPVRRKPQRMTRATSTRRPTRSRINRPLFSGDSELSEDAFDDDDPDDNEDDEHRDLRNCLMSASNFGTFLVRYVTRQCLDYNDRCDEIKRITLRNDELEKRTIQLEKQNKHLEEIRDEQMAQAYDMNGDRESLIEKIDLSERSVRRLANENDKLRHELSVANERCANLDDQVAKTNESLSKARQRYEQEIVTLRRNTNSLQQEKATLSKKNDELRVELKGKLQRAGLKANVDEYLAERKRENANAASSAGADGTVDRIPSTGTLDGAAAEQEIKRLQETVQFWRKKTDRMNRKLRTEKLSNKEAHRMLRIQQEETYRYQQTFGPLPDDIAGDGMEVLGDYMSTMIGSPGDSGLRRPSTHSATIGNKRGVEGDSEADSDMLSGDLSDSSDGSKLDRSRHRAHANMQVRDDASIAASGREADGVSEKPVLARVGSRSSISSANKSDSDVDENADDDDIRRYEMRMRNRRAVMATPKARKAGTPKTGKTTSARRGKNNRLSIDVTAAASGMAGESLGDILGSGSQWGEVSSARSKTGSIRGHMSTKSNDGHFSSSLAAELNGAGGSMDWNPSSPTRAIPATSPPAKSRTHSSRGSLYPFNDGSNAFGIGYGESVNLAEQLSEAAKKHVFPTPKPVMVDASTSTEPALRFADAQVEAAPIEPTCADASVYAALSPPSSVASVCTSNTEQNAYCSTGVDPQVSASALTDCEMQTDPLVGVVHMGVEAISTTTHVSVQAISTTTESCVATTVLATMCGDKSIDNVASCAACSVQAVPEALGASMTTDPLVGMTDSSTQSDIIMLDQACQSVVDTAERAMSTDSAMFMSSKQVEAIAGVRSFGIYVGAGIMRDTMVATVDPVLVDRGSDAVVPKTAESGTSAKHIQTCDVQVATDSTMLLSWLAPLIPEGVASSAVFEALDGMGEPIYEYYTKQAEDDARAAAKAEHERLAAISAEEAAACIKTYVDSAVSPDPTLTCERAVQAIPQMTNTSQQPDNIPLSETGVDAPVQPGYESVSVATELQVITRWVKPFDPVAKMDASMLASVETVDSSTFHDIECASVAVGPTVEFKDVSVVAAVGMVSQSTSIDIVLKNASVGQTVELCERAVSPITNTTMSVAVGTDISTDTKAVGPKIISVDKSTSNVTDCSSVCVEAGCANTASVGTYTTVETAEKATAPDALSMVSSGVEPDITSVSHAGIAATASVEHASISPIEMPTPKMEARGVYTDTVASVDAFVQPEPTVASNPVKTVSTAEVGIVAAPEAMVLVDQSVSTAANSKDVATQSELDQFEHIAYSPPNEVSPTEDSGARTADSFESVGKLSSHDSVAADEDNGMYEDAKAAQAAEDEPVVVPVRPSLRPSPTVPLPPPPSFARPSLPVLPSHHVVSSVSAPHPTAKALSAMELERVLKNSSRSEERHQITRSSTPEKISDGEDYGYIMVSPRTNVQRIPVSAISSSCSSSVANGSSEAEDCRYPCLTVTHDLKATEMALVQQIPMFVSLGVISAMIMI